MKIEKNTVKIPGSSAVATPGVSWNRDKDKGRKSLRVVSGLCKCPKLQVQGGDSRHGHKV